MKRVARQQRDKEEKREAILKVSRELFFELGYKKATMGMIAQNLNIAVGTLYTYYRNKFEIYKTIQEEALDLIARLIGEALASSENAIEQLRAVATAYLTYYRDYRDYFDIAGIMTTTSEELTEPTLERNVEINKKSREILDVLAAIIRQGIDSGEMRRDVDPWKAANALWGFFDGLILLETRDDLVGVSELSLDELTDQALDLIFSGLMKA